MVPKKILQPQLKSLLIININWLYRKGIKGQPAVNVANLRNLHLLLFFNRNQLHAGD